MKTSEICKECSQQSDCCFIDNGLQHRCGVVSAYKRGFEDGIGHGWHPASELPPEEGEYIAIDNGMPGVFWVDYLEPFGWCVEVMGAHEVVNVKWWCYPPKEE